MPTDLLDMFKPRPGKGASPARATSRSREATPHGSSRGMGPTDTVGTRKLVLGGAVVVLLLALAFTAGVGVGRARRTTVALGTDPTLAAVPVADPWGMRGRDLPSLAAMGDSLKGRVLEDFVRRWPELSDRISLIDVKGKAGKPTGMFRVVVQGFESRDDALRYAEDLRLWAVDGQLPFRDCRPERMSDKK